MLSRRRCGNGRLKLDVVATDGEECMECDGCKVCLREFRSNPRLISIGLIGEEKSKSSLLSDCTKGLVGGLNMKLDEYDDDREGARERGPKSVSRPSVGGNRGSY